MRKRRRGSRKEKRDAVAAGRERERGRERKGLSGMTEEKEIGEKSRISVLDMEPHWLPLALCLSRSLSLLLCLPRGLATEYACLG